MFYVIIGKIEGSQNLMIVTNSQINIFYCEIINVTTYSPYIFQIYFSMFFMSFVNASYFYPQFIYASFSALYISNCSFSNSFEQNGMFEVGTIVFEHNVTFTLEFNEFISLENSLFGPVSLILIFL